jgi:preprotein translocase subunit SecG
MLSLLIILQVVLGVVLVGIILLQKGKGAEMGVSFGAGASDTLFGSSGPMSVMAKFTWGLAFLFMLNSIGISYIIYKSSTASMIKASHAPAQEQAQKSHVKIKIPAKQKDEKSGAPITK